MELDCEQCCPPHGECRISFINVKQFNISDNRLPRWWLYNEIELIDEKYFKLQVLFDYGECELVAEDLIIEEI